MSSNGKKIALAAAALFAAVAVVGIGFAAFTAQTGNEGNEVATGTLVLSNDGPQEGVCFSNAGTADGEDDADDTDVNDNPTCDTLFDVALAKPGDSTSQELTLENEGTLNGSSLEVFSNACESERTGSVSGSGDLCDVLEIKITTDDGSCVVGTGNTCAHVALNDFEGVANKEGVDDAFASGDEVTVTIALRISEDAGNEYQGLTATFDLQWLLTQEAGGARNP